MGTRKPGKRGGGAAPPDKNKKAIKSTFHYHSYIKDTISVQKRHNYVNDDEVHEANPHLRDFLVPHHSGLASLGSVGQADNDIEYGKKLPTLSRPCASILHNQDCPSRHSCDITESKRHISFHQVVVRDYDMVLGDHPNCSYGPPVTLGWHYVEYEPLDLNEYEYHHSRRRPIRQLCLNYYKRKEILSVDNSTDELKKATKTVSRTKTQRAITRQLLPFLLLFDAFESAGRKIKRIAKKDESKHKTWDAEDELDWSVHGSAKKSSIKR